MVSFEILKTSRLRFQNFQFFFEDQRYIGAYFQKRNQSLSGGHGVDTCNVLCLYSYRFVNWSRSRPRHINFKRTFYVYFLIKSVIPKTFLVILLLFSVLYCIDKHWLSVYQCIFTTSEEVDMETLIKATICLTVAFSKTFNRYQQTM